MEENPGTSSESAPKRTRRRLVDYENVEFHDIVNNNHSRSHRPQPVGWFSILPKRFKSYLGPRGTKSINVTILVFVVLLAISTIWLSIKIKLMNRLGNGESNQEGGDDDNIDENLVEDLKKPSIESETTTSQPVLHGKISSQEQQTQEIWKKPRSDNFYRCPYNPKLRKGNDTQSNNGYILIHANGGLNQMRAGIADMVAVAKIMNAVLILPELDHTSYWSDPSGFKEIFDWERFIEALKGDVEVLESLPPSLAEVKPFKKVPISWSKATYYRDLVPLLKRHRVIKFINTDSRVANNGLMPSLQKLRCHAMYEALRFSRQIQELAQKLIRRLREHDTHYVALHLRYEKDMLAFTGCDHKLTKEESKEFEKLRYRMKHWKKKRINGATHRLHGDCPMTPTEASLFLRALGFSPNTTIYICSGDIYGENSLANFKKRFPNTFSHSDLATDEELVLYSGRHNKLAALDYLVAVDSDVFTYTYYGNMAKAVRGHRMFLNYRKTFDPDMARFVKLVDQLEEGIISEEDFDSRIKSIHKNRIGGPSFRQAKKPYRHEEPFYANPYPGCICDG